ncbi:hypothetical protein GCM10020218_096430 [Dactylosporangium vinaceum]
MLRVDVGGSTFAAAAARAHRTVPAPSAAARCAAPTTAPMLDEGRRDQAPSHGSAGRRDPVAGLRRLPAGAAVPAPGVGTRRVQPAARRPRRVLCHTIRMDGSDVGNANPLTPRPLATRPAAGAAAPGGPAVMAAALALKLLAATAGPAAQRRG